MTGVVLSWEAELEELRRREALAEQMGGPDKVARQHGRGKMDARARLAALCDDGTFREIGKIAGKASYDEDGNLETVLPAPFLFGKARINGRPVVATADDFTIRGGAADAGISRKMVQAEKMAHELKLPIIRMIDGTGGGGSVKTLEQIGATYIPAVPGWGDVVTNLDTVPVVALALGPTAGLGAARVVASGEHDDYKWRFSLVYVEIYNERVKDLLNPMSGCDLDVREDARKGTHVAGAVEVAVGSLQEIMELMNKGSLYRTTEATNCNAVSSRSHAVLQVSVEALQKFGDGGGRIKRLSKLSMIDLAGSERATKTGAEGKAAGSRAREPPDHRDSGFGSRGAGDGTCRAAAASMANDIGATHKPPRECARRVHAEPN